MGKQVRFTVKGTGWYLVRALRRFVQDCADGLAAHAGAPPAAPAR